MTAENPSVGAGAICIVGIILVATLLQPLHSEPPPKDYKDISLKELGVSLIEPKKDSKTGFIVGGNNATSLIKKLTEINGISILDLEKSMRPEESSVAGFLGKDESLLEVLTTDNQYVVDELGLTHQELAKHLHVLAAIGMRQEGKQIIYHGRKFKIRMIYSKGYQDSPFKDDTKTDSEAVIFNLENGKDLRYSLLVPMMIERYGFYEGKGTSYRVDPRKVMDVLDFLKEKVKKK
jgi:hypothetical protein